jgi:hypothetical protein
MSLQVEDVFQYSINFGNIMINESIFFFFLVFFNRHSFSFFSFSDSQDNTKK